MWSNREWTIDVRAELSNAALLQEELLAKLGPIARSMATRSWSTAPTRILATPAGMDAAKAAA